MEKINFVNGQAPAINATNLNQMQTNIEQAIAVGGVAGDTLPIGSVVEFASDVNVPANWLLCNGQAVSRTEYDLLFAIIGTTWGEGDGSTTFNVPTKEGLVTVGKKSSDTDFNTIGKTGGEKTHTLTVDEMPIHNHSLPIANGEETGTYFEYQYGTGKRWYSGYDTMETTGGSQPHNNLQPYVTSNFIIKAKQSAGVVATVVDNLNSTSSTDALSANQGKILNEKIEQHITTGQEFATNEFIDEKQVYRKRINIDSLPNADKVEYSTGLSNVTMLRYSGMAYDNNNNAFCLPFMYVNVDDCIGLLYLNATGKIRIITGIDRSGLTGYVDLYYTKNS